MGEGEDVKSGRGRTTRLGGASARLVSKVVLPCQPMSYAGAGAGLAHTLTPTRHRLGIPGRWRQSTHVQFSLGPVAKRADIGQSNAAHDPVGIPPWENTARNYRFKSYPARN